MPLLSHPTDQAPPIMGVLRALTVVVVGVIAAVAAALFWNESNQDSLLDRISNFHLATITQTEGIKENLPLLDNALLMSRLKNAETGSADGAGQALGLRLGLIKDHLDAISRLQEGYQGDEFAPVVAKAQEQFARAMRQQTDLLQSNMAIAEKRVSALRGFGLSIGQLERLHLIAREAEIQASASSRRNYLRQLTFFLLPLFFIGAVAVMRIMRWIRRAIESQAAATAALRESEASLANAQRVAQTGNWDWNIETGALHWSDEIYRIFGRTPQEFPATYEFFLNAVHPDDRATVETAVAAAVSDGPPYNIDHRICLPDGEIRTVNEQGVVEFNEEGVAVRMVGTVQDITERKKGETALRESEERYARAVAGTNDGLWDWNIQTGEDYFSPRWKEILGYADHEMEPHFETFADAIHPDDRDRAMQAVQDHLGKHTPYALEIRLRRKPGDYVWVLAKGQAVWDGNGEPLRMAGSISDISDRKQAEQQILRLNEDLENRVMERTAELRKAHEELVRSERLATLGQLTATVSHELRNPLGAMRTSIYMLRNHMLSTDERLIRAAERIDRNISRCDAIVDELLDFARIRNLELSVTALDDWLGGVLDEQSVPQGVEVRYNRGGADIAAKIDPDRLRRAVINIFENGCQAMQELAGEKVLTVTTRAAGDRIELLFRDSGPGITPEVREKIFEPLFSTKGFGVGLGLCVVRQIMEKHGGGVEITSETGVGTDVVLWLPLHRFMEAAE